MIAWFWYLPSLGKRNKAYHLASLSQSFHATLQATSKVSNVLGSMLHNKINYIGDTVTIFLWQVHNEDIITSSADGSIKVWNIESTKIDDNELCKKMKFSITSQDFNLQIRYSFDMHDAYTPQRHIHSFDCSGSEICFGDDGCNIKFWDPATGWLSVDLSNNVCETYSWALWLWCNCKDCFRESLEFNQGPLTHDSQLVPLFWQHVLYTEHQ